MAPSVALSLRAERAGASQALAARNALLVCGCNTGLGGALEARDDAAGDGVAQLGRGRARNFGFDSQMSFWTSPFEISLNSPFFPERLATRDLNRTCGFPAYGSPTGFISRHTTVVRFREQERTRYAKAPAEAGAISRCKSGPGKAVAGRL